MSYLFLCFRSNLVFIQFYSTFLFFHCALMLNMFYYFRIIEADAYVLSMCEGRVLLEQSVGQSA